MPDERAHESADLEDYTVLSNADTLDDTGVDDPYDRGVAPPQHWSAAMRQAERGDEESESLDQHLAEEEPDPTADEAAEDERDDVAEADEDMAEEDLDGLLLADGPDPRAGRLTEEHDQRANDGDLVARDAGIDGGAATAEEAAVHVVEEDDYDIRSE